MEDSNEKTIDTMADTPLEAIIPELAELPEEVGADVVDVPVDTKAGNSRDKNDFRKNARKQSRREPRARIKPEFDNKLLEIRRVARVVSGGRRFSFSATLVVGDRKGKVGVGIGKASDTPVAIEKAFRDGKKNMITVRLNSKSSIDHSVEAKYGASRIMISPAPGKGIIAGSSVRAILDMAGVTAVSAKILSRSKNKINNARAAIKALSKLQERKR